MNEEIYRRAIGKLKAMTPPKIDPASINMDTEIYGDLRLYGDDITELLIWIKEEFGVLITISGGKYAPSETPFFAITETIKKAIWGGRHRYKSLKVCDIVQAIDAGGGQFD